MRGNWGVMMQQMPKHKLDSIDLQILEELQNDGKITNVELAQRVGISAPPCLRRVKHLEDSGYIKSYHAELNANLLGYHVTIFAQVSLSKHGETNLQTFEQLVKTWPIVRECHMLAGETDFLLKIIAPDWEAYQQFLTTQLTAAINVTHVKSSLAIRNSKHEHGIPFDLAEKTKNNAA